MVPQPLNVFMKAIIYGRPNPDAIHIRGCSTISHWPVEEKIRERWVQRNASAMKAIKYTRENLLKNGQGRKYDSKPCEWLVIGDSYYVTMESPDGLTYWQKAPDGYRTLESIKLTHHIVKELTEAEVFAELL